MEEVKSALRRHAHNCTGKETELKFYYFASDISFLAKGNVENILYILVCARSLEHFYVAIRS